MTTITIRPFATVAGEEIPDITDNFQFTASDILIYDPRTFAPYNRVTFNAPMYELKPSPYGWGRAGKTYVLEMVAEKLKQDFIKKFS